MNDQKKSIPRRLRRSLPSDKTYHIVKNRLTDKKINTVCISANCPNKWECFSRGTATFLIMGNICTRACSFCNVSKGTPEPLDNSEVDRITSAAREFSLKHVVLTSVTRDDIGDGGADYFYKAVTKIKKELPDITIEILTPDFNGEVTFLQRALSCKPDIFAHNIEMIPRLYNSTRPTSSYERSMDVLRNAGAIIDRGYVKTGFMVGLGETHEEVIELIENLRQCGVDILTIGQYLKPGRHCEEVKEYISQERFDEYKSIAYKTGFKYVCSGPYVRSSYRAEDALKRENVSA